MEVKWPGTREACHDFNAEAVAVLSRDDVDTLVQNTRVICNRKKLKAVVQNAGRMLDFEKTYDSFNKRYLRSHKGASKGPHTYLPGCAHLGVGLAIRSPSM